MQNKLNLELKYFCKDFLKIRKVLLKIRAKKVTVKKQKDYFFNLPASKVNHRFKLRIEGKNQILVYYERPNFEKNRPNSAKVILFPTKDKKLFKFLTATLGVKAVVTKSRELWEKGNTVFNLDTVENIGNIFEIETATNNKNQKKDEKIFNEYKEKFSPFLTKLIKGSNLDLVSKVEK